MDKKVILLILDGWGIAKPDKFNAIDNANTPNFDMLKERYPYMTLKADGENVGLPVGQMGTSEVNHQAMGTGKIEKQTLVKIDDAIKNNELQNNEEINKLVNQLKDKGSRLHFIGIISDGGIHYQSRHLFHLLDILKRKSIDNEVYFHLFTDGRDVPPKSAKKYIKELEEKINELGIGIIATVQGRLYLDRDRDWDKTNIAFDLINSSKGKKVDSWEQAIDDAYINNHIMNDQYIQQYLIVENSKLEKNDVVICWGYRVDRQFQILKRILDENIENLLLTSFVNPSKSFAFNPIFPEGIFNNTLSEVICKANKTQYRITETEKYTHLTYFFNGHREEEWPGETWMLHQSNRFVKPEYGFEPSMRTFDITKNILDNIKNDNYDFQVINLAQTDMVGHTGNYNAAVIAAESADYCVSKIYDRLKDKLDKYALIITADHGNSDEMWDYEADQPHTRHTLNPVPFIVVTDGVEELEGENLLSSIAPTILELMNLEKPTDMESESLLKK